MTIQLPRPLKAIDRRLLLNAPEVWLTQVHLLTFYVLLSLLILVVLASAVLVLPVYVGVFYSFIPLLISAVITLVWLQYQIRISKQVVPFKYQRYSYTHLFLCAIIVLNSGPILFAWLCTKHYNLTLFNGFGCLLWSLFIILSAVWAISSAIGVSGPYPIVTMTWLMMLFQVGTYLILWANHIIRLLPQISFFVVLICTICTLLISLKKLPRWAKFFIIALLFETMPCTPLLLIGLSELLTGEPKPTRSVELSAALLGLALSIILAPFWERKLLYLNAQPI